MKKILTALLIIGVCTALLAGCGHEHTWNAATCTSPATCSECGETEGEPSGHTAAAAATCEEDSLCAACGELLEKATGHSMSEATCAAAATCTVCGKVEGEPLEHTMSEPTCTAAATCTVCGVTEGEPTPHNLSEATYTAAAVCSECGETVGEPLTADFVRYGITADMQLGVPRDYVTVASNGQLTGGVTTITAHDIIDGDDIRPVRDGYKWHIVTFSTHFSDPVALTHGMSVDYTATDYYDIAYFMDAADHSDPAVSQYTVKMNGEDAYVYLGQSGEFVPHDDGTVTLVLKFSVQVPVGYDGVVIGINNGMVDARINNYLFDVYSPENFLLYRIFG